MNRRFTLSLAGLLGLGAANLWADRERDVMLLALWAGEITSNLQTDAERIHAVNDWVYHHRGFATNDGYFVVPAFGPTPLQVLQNGGDCADKSRLVAAMLGALNIRAGLIMLSPCRHCGFIHTVVEAQHETGRMVVDPIWNVDYPVGVRELAGTSLGRARLAELQRERGAADKIAAMPPSEATFDNAVAVNWDKNIATRAAAAILGWLGYEPESMFRPDFLEDPKAALFMLLVGALETVLVVGLLGGGLTPGPFPDPPRCAGTRGPIFRQRLPRKISWFRGTRGDEERRVG